MMTKKSLNNLHPVIHTNTHMLHKQALAALSLLKYGTADFYFPASDVVFYYSAEVDFSV